MNNHDELLMQITSSMTRAARAYKTAADKVASKHGLSQATAWPVVMIHQMGDKVRPGEVADALGLDPSSVVRVIDQLIAAKLLTREEDANDRRARILTLTEDGHTRAKQVREDMTPFRRKLFDGIEEEKLKTCLEVIQKLGNAVKKSSSC